MKYSSRLRPGFWMLPLAAFVLLLCGQTNARAVPVAGLGNTNRLIFFDSDAPDTIVADVSITGLRAGERVLAIDFRPLTGQIYALGSTSRLYTLNPVTGAAVQVGSSPFTPALSGVQSATGFDIDFDPVTDTLRVVSEGGQNLRLDPETGAVVSVGGALAFAPTEEEPGRTPDIRAIAYTNNFKGATSTTLYGVDWRRGSLVRIGSHGGVPVSPDTGQTFIQSHIIARFNGSPNVALDIAANSGFAYLMLMQGDPLSVETTLFVVNLSDGTLTHQGRFAPGEIITDITILDRAVDLYAITASNKLLRFNSGTPGTIISSLNITNLQTANEKIIGFDYLADRFLYFITDASRVYHLDVATGAAQYFGTMLTYPLNGTDFGLTTTPQGYARTVSDTEQNLLVLPYTPVGSTPRTPLAYAASDPHAGANPNVVGASFTHGEPAAAAMFDIDSNLDILARQGEANGDPLSSESGRLFTIGPLGVDTTGAVGFDIEQSPLLFPCNADALRTGAAFASLTAPGETVSKLYAINLRTGAASLQGTIGGGELIRGVAVVPLVGLFRFSAVGFAADEGAGSVEITVVRSGDTNVAASVDYSTRDAFNFYKAEQNQDYTIAFGRLHFAPGETSKSFRILITDDGVQDPGGFFAETFAVELSNPTGGFGLDRTYTLHDSSINTLSLISVSIRDNDETAPATNPIDDADFFVRQHYADFLSREPDAAGLAFWKNEITSCGANVACVERKRINVSAAFFRSVEFQQTGFFVYRLYRATFKRAPRYREFMQDTQKMGRGVVVGATGWEARLEANRLAFLNEWVNCKTFKDAFASQTNEEYVDALFANAGIVPDPSERQALVSGLDNGTETRASVLRRVADDPAFRQKESNPAFVLVEYFGYLRRNPDDPPDNNLNGYNFWLAKLNSFGGDPVRAEMVKAFITSGEYRRRFFEE
jgi:hypothetical protein